MIGCVLMARIAATSSAPFARKPAAPPAFAARAMADMKIGPWSGLSARAWQETMSDPLAINMRRLLFHRTRCHALNELARQCDIEKGDRRGRDREAGKQHTPIRRVFA